MTYIRRGVINTNRSSTYIPTAIVLVPVTMNELVRVARRVSNPEHPGLVLCFRMNVDKQAKRIRYRYIDDLSNNQLETLCRTLREKRSVASLWRECSSNCVLEAERLLSVAWYVGGLSASELL